AGGGGARPRDGGVAAPARVLVPAPLRAPAPAPVGPPAPRARGTLGGRLAPPDPVSEFPCVAATLAAELVLASSGGRRSVAAGDFFQGYFTTALQPGELLVEVRFPQVADGAGWGFAELARKAGDYALVAAASELQVRHGKVVEARIGLAGAADRPVRARAAGQLLRRRPGDASRRLRLRPVAAGAG